VPGDLLPFSSLCRDAVGRERTFRVLERLLTERERRTADDVAFLSMKTPILLTPMNDRMLVRFLVAALASAALTAPAATLTAVPMQGGMVMPMIAYQAGMGRLHVMLDPAIPQLTPLAVSHPGDGFAPEDPWFEALDPSRQGLAFSRRYGFVMNTETDPLPDGTKIWLRKVTGVSGTGSIPVRQHRAQSLRADLRHRRLTLRHGVERHDVSPHLHRPCRNE
jgi:hypothetical protein